MPTSTRSAGGDVDPTTGLITTALPPTLAAVVAGTGGPLLGNPGVGPATAAPPVDPTAVTPLTGTAAAEIQASMAAFSAQLGTLRSEMSDSKIAADAKILALTTQLSGQEARNLALEGEIASLRDANGANEKGKKVDERVFLPTSSDSPFFPLPRNHTTFKPFVAPLKGDPTHDGLDGEALEEYKTLHWCAKSLHDCNFHLGVHFDEWLSAIGEGTLPVSPDRSAAFLEALKNTLEETHSLLLHRFQIIVTRVYLKSAHGGLTVGDQALLDYLHTELYGVHPGQHVVDPAIQKLIDAFGAKVVYSKLNAGAKVDAQANAKIAQQPSAKQQRKDRLARENAAKAKKAGKQALLAAPSE